MPPQNLVEKPDMIILCPDGLKVRFDGITGVTFSDDSVEVEAPLSFVTNELTLNIPADWHYYFTHGKAPSNNWRKMHGLPLRRKARKR